jgi:hypothetical protein
LDWELPWGGGDGVLACLCDEDRGAMPAIVLVSDHDCPPELADAPVIGRLRKPFKLTELFETIVDGQELLVS